MRLGDLDALKEEISSWGMNDYEPSDFIDAIDAAPTVEINTNDIEYKAYCKGLADGKKIARPQGEWIIHNKGEHNEWRECPYCNNHKKYYARFCDHCGAEMQKGGTE